MFKIAHMKPCSICCIRKKEKHLYQLCANCIGDDKLQCLQCYAGQLRMNNSNDLLVSHCAFCRCRFYTELNTPFGKSYFFIKKANELRKDRLEVRELDRQVLMQTVSHLHSRLEMHRRRDNLRIAKRRRRRVARRQQMDLEYPNNSDEEEAIQDDNDVVPHPDLPANYISILELFNTSTIEEPITP